MAQVARQFVTLSKDTLDPRIGVALLMEAAITHVEGRSGHGPADAPPRHE